MGLEDDPISTVAEFRGLEISLPSAPGPWYAVYCWRHPKERVWLVDLVSRDGTSGTTVPYLIFMTTGRVDPRPPDELYPGNPDYGTRVVRVTGVRNRDGSWSRSVTTK